MKSICKISTVLVFLSSLSSCVRDKFDAPPNGANEDPPGVVATMSIKAFKEAYWKSALLTPVKDDVVIVGVVNSDDKSGNFYKVVTIQDESGGIQVKIDQTNLYTDYPIGRRIFIKCKDLYVGDYSGLVQIGGYIDMSSGQPELGGIPSALVGKHILKGKWGIPVVPKEVSIGQLKSSRDYQSTLVKLNDVKFITSDTSKPWADALYKNSYTYTLQNCKGQNIPVRTSGYSAFSNEKTPRGGGSFTCVVSYYSSSASFDPAGVQLNIRDLNDVQMNGPRCDPGTEPGLAGIRFKYYSGITTIPAGTTIVGTVISDKDNSNINSRSMAFQDTFGNAIILYMTSSVTIPLGTQISVNLGGLTVGEYFGVVQVLNVTSAHITTISGLPTVKPKVVTIAQANADYPSNESSLLKLNNVTLSGTYPNYYGGNQSGFNLEIKDGTVNTLPLRTLKTATFASVAYPTGNVSITGIMGGYNGAPQLSLRNTSDVQ